MGVDLQGTVESGASGGTFSSLDGDHAGHGLVARLHAAGEPLPQAGISSSQDGISLPGQMRLDDLEGHPPTTGVGAGAVGEADIGAVVGVGGTRACKGSEGLLCKGQRAEKRDRISKTDEGQGLRNRRLRQSSAQLLDSDS